MAELEEGHPEIECPECDGKGRYLVVWGWTDCALCDGQGRFPIFTPPTKDAEANE